VIRAIVTDIEGTTSPIAFVRDVLFPYARERMAEFLRDSATEPSVRDALAEIDTACGRALAIDEATALLVSWIDEDRKLGPLKRIQGMIWRGGYERHELVAEIYDDVPEQLRRWRASGIELCVYSSGSEEAQRLIFGYSRAGDLSVLFAAFFDTRIGAKRDRDSYARIARDIAVAPAEILFLSDVGGELDAARAAGMQTCQLVRDETIVPAEGHRHAADFTQVLLET
jgi:enolase-phosphatase E1